MLKLQREDFMWKYICPIKLIDGNETQQYPIFLSEILQVCSFSQMEFVFTGASVNKGSQKHDITKTYSSSKTSPLSSFYFIFNIWTAPFSNMQINF